MEYLKILFSSAAAMPDLLSLLLCPALLLVTGLTLAVFRLKRAYLPVAAGLGGAALFLVVAESMDAAVSLGYLGLYAVFSVLVRLLFLIPFRTKKRENARSEEIYQKFRADLEPVDFAEPVEPSEARDRDETYSAEESGLRLAHVNSLLGQLQNSELSAGDRLEADAIARSLDVYRDRALNAEEMRSLNDCLASVLKLTAKYKL